MCQQMLIFFMLARHNLRLSVFLLGLWVLVKVFAFGVCMSYAKCKPHNTMIQASYSWIYHGEQSACHLVYYPRG